MLAKKYQNLDPFENINIHPHVDERKGNQILRFPKYDVSK